MHLLDPTSSTSLAGPLVEALLTVLVQCECNDDSYWLHMEAAAALCVCMSTQLFSHLSDPTPQPLVTAALTSGGPGAELLVSRLLHYIIKRPPPPAQPTGILRRIGSAAKSVLLLPYYTISYLSYYLSARKDDAEGDVRLELADRALQLLLLLTQHLPPALFSPETYPPIHSSRRCARLATSAPSTRPRQPMWTSPRRRAAAPSSRRSRVACARRACRSKSCTTRSPLCS